MPRRNETLPPRNCKICGKTFCPRGWAAEICSPECKKINSRRLYEIRRDELKAIRDEKKRKQKQQMAKEHKALKVDKLSGENVDYSYGDKQRERYEKLNQVVFPNWVKVTKHE